MVTYVTDTSNSSKKKEVQTCGTRYCNTVSKNCVISCEGILCLIKNSVIHAHFCRYGMKLLSTDFLTESLIFIKAGLTFLNYNTFNKSVSLQKKKKTKYINNNNSSTINI